MHLRRALLLFAIVLGLAALVASFSGPPEREARQAQPAPERARGEPVERAALTLRFAAGGAAERRTLASGRHATLVVSVPEPGQVSIEGLGLVGPSDRLTPARFDVLAHDPGRFEVTFQPADGGAAHRIGSLVVERRRARPAS